MKRRQFIAALGASTIVMPFGALAQQPPAKIPRIGVLWHASNAQEENVPLTAMRQGLTEIGYIDGQNVILENRFPAEQPERFQIMAAELVAQKVDVLIGVTLPAALAAKRATQKIPVGAGLVDNLARPSGNVTGLSVMTVELIGKQIELLHEVVPKASRIGLLVNVSNSVGASSFIDAARAAAGQRGLTIQPIEVRATDDITQVLSAVGPDQIDGIVLTQDGIFFRSHRRVSEWALRLRLPMITFARNIVEDGALLSYAPSLTGGQRRVAYFVDKILKGAKPSDLPVEQPTKIEMFVNAKTAKAIGITLPPTLLATADEVFE
jgi:putative ABC transport system substrate-binding protein